jgi:hypothetical protein
VLLCSRIVKPFVGSVFARNVPEFPGIVVVSDLANTALVRRFERAKIARAKGQTQEHRAIAKTSLNRDEKLVFKEFGELESERPGK